MIQQFDGVLTVVLSVVGVGVALAGLITAQNRTIRAELRAFDQRIRSLDKRLRAVEIGLSHLAGMAKGGARLPSEPRQTQT